jgi:predicted metal-dependent hydrolase
MDMDDEQPAEIEIIRSAGRTKTASARWDTPGRKIVVRVPDGLERAEEQRLVDSLVARVRAGLRRRTLNSDDALATRAADLNRRYFGGRLRVDSITWVTNQKSRYGSCTPATRTIRISDRVATMPQWVQDYVLVHELAHLIEANHSAAFWKLVNRYALTERARGYLMALGLEGMEGPEGEV